MHPRVRGTRLVEIGATGSDLTSAGARFDLGWGQSVGYRFSKMRQPWIKWPRVETKPRFFGTPVLGADSLRFA